MSLMQIPRKIEYALRAMIHLADHPDGVARGIEIARDEQIPKYFLEKVIRDLMRRGLVRARRGPGGGYQLARPADERHLQGHYRGGRGADHAQCLRRRLQLVRLAAGLPDVPRVGGGPARAARDFFANHAQRDRRFASRADAPGKGPARCRRQGSRGRQGLSGSGHRPSATSPPPSAAHSLHLIDRRERIDERTSRRVGRGQRRRRAVRREVLLSRRVLRQEPAVRADSARRRAPGRTRLAGAHAARAAAQSGPMHRDRLGRRAARIMRRLGRLAPGPSPRSSIPAPACARAPTRPTRRWRESGARCARDRSWWRWPIPTIRPISPSSPRSSRAGCASSS